MFQQETSEFGLTAARLDRLPLFIWVYTQEPHLSPPVTQLLLLTAPAVQKQHLRLKREGAASLRGLQRC